jgi:hypothetical protein
MTVMDKHDLAELLNGASAEEVDRIHRLLHEWSVGPESTFPVQLALLTRAQWRMAASVPRLLNDSRKWLELHLTEYRRQSAVLVEQFGDTSSTALEAFESVVGRHTEALKMAVAQSSGHLEETESTARLIKFELEHGTAALKRDLDKVRGELVDERVRMDKARQDLEAKMSIQEWFRLILLSLCMFCLGAGIALMWAHSH